MTTAPSLHERLLEEYTLVEAHPLAQRAHAIWEKMRRDGVTTFELCIFEEYDSFTINATGSLYVYISLPHLEAVAQHEAALVYLLMSWAMQLDNELVQGFGSRIRQLEDMDNMSYYGLIWHIVKFVFYVLYMRIYGFFFGWLIRRRADGKALKALKQCQSMGYEPEACLVFFDLDMPLPPLDHLDKDAQRTTRLEQEEWLLQQRHRQQQQKARLLARL